VKDSEENKAKFGSDADICIRKTLLILNRSFSVNSDHLSPVFAFYSLVAVD
jgi:hypothetical protein